MPKSGRRKRHSLKITNEIGFCGKALLQEYHPAENDYHPTSRSRVYSHLEVGGGEAKGGKDIRRRLHFPDPHLPCIRWRWAARLSLRLHDFPHLGSEQVYEPGEMCTVLTCLSKSAARLKGSAYLQPSHLQNLENLKVAGGLVAVSGSRSGLETVCCMLSSFLELAAICGEI